MVLATSVVVLGVAAVRSRSKPGRIPDDAVQFAVSAPGIMTAALVSAGVLATVAFAAARLETREVRARLRLGSTRASAMGIVAGVIGMVGLSLACGGVNDLVGWGGRGTMGAIARALEELSPGGIAVAIATIAIAPGAAEETFFRGLVQTGLTARLGRWPSIFLTAFGFGLMHFDLVQGFVAFVAGVFLGWVSERLGGVRASIAAHVCNNAAFVALASFGAAANGTSRGGDVVVIAAGLIAWTGATALLRSNFALRADKRSAIE
ncbi:MAG: CPBP family intramembrane glutamic endopeptidase [Polyangiaceae bacterium]